MKNWFLIVIILLFTTCKKGHEFDCFKSAGEITTEYFDLDRFTKITVRNKIHLEIVQESGKRGIEITFNKNLIGGISKEIKNDELVLDNYNKCNWVRSYNLQPVVRLFCDESLEQITMHGAAKVFNNDTLKVQKLIINNSSVEDAILTVKDVNGIECNGFNSGGFIIKGQAGYMATTIDDASSIDLRDFIVDDLYLYHYSLKSSYIQSRDLMMVELYGQGDVFLENIPSDTTRWKCCKVDLQRFGYGVFK